MSNSAEFTYDLSEMLPFEGLSSLRPGTSVLVTGPTMAGKDRLLYDVLGDGVSQNEAGIVVTTDGDGGESVDMVRSKAETADDSLLSAIDCRAQSDREETERDDGSCVYSVSSPSEFTSIGIGITDAFSRAEEANVTRGRLALTSLSTMVRYADQKTVFKFCHVLSQRLNSAGFIGLFTLNSDAHDEQTISVIKQAFDANIEIREVDGEKQGRVLGLGSQPTEWRPLS
ncbi:RAD55 family ATPase [Halovenus rubra]|uniref:RAD55 family ATPase n=2 Tax=Halovenus rubra TaxID=869890 RepID=A0ACC7E0B1_9EURY|nr:hypothetical protein [Halovenus rubra]